MKPKGVSLFDHKLQDWVFACTPIMEQFMCSISSGDMCPMGVVFSIMAFTPSTGNKSGLIMICFYI